MTRGRVAAGFLLAALLLPAMTAVAHAHGLELADGVLLFLAAVVGVALLGGLGPALLAAVGGFLLLNYFFTAPVRSFDVNTGRGALALAVFVLVALAVSWIVDLAARRLRRAEAAAAEAHVLAAVAGGVLAGPFPLAGLLSELRDLFALESVALLERVGGGWRVAASTGTGPPPNIDISDFPDSRETPGPAGATATASPSRPGASDPGAPGGKASACPQAAAGPQDATAQLDDAGFLVLAGDGLMLAVRGRELDANEQRIAAAFGAQAAVALRQQRLATAAEGDRVRSALLAAVSHDLRTPLAAAKAAVEGLRHDEDQRSTHPDPPHDDDRRGDNAAPGHHGDPYEDTDRPGSTPDLHALTAHDRRELLATADESLDRLGGLLANLLDMSRLQAGALAVHSTDVGLEDVVPPALDELGGHGRAVRVRLPDDLPPVRADPGLLQRVLVNVIGNALRYSPAGRPPELAGRVAGERVELRVVDHGPGLPPGDRERVFQAFQRLGDRDNHTGVGLGLALSRGLTEAMDGTLKPEETPGGGLTMVLSLPMGTP